MPQSVASIPMRSLMAAALAAALMFPWCALAQSPLVHNIFVKTSDVLIQLNAGSHAPRLKYIRAQGSAPLRNLQPETLPATVVVRGVSVPVTWELKAELCSSGPDHATFVYDSAQPHLRLRWQWQARAAFGPLEHRITVDNLGDQEVWLPLIDSLHLDWQLPAGASLLNFYVEKSADTPSNQGVHLETIADGYRWFGRSSTYAHPIEGESREIIPVEFIYAAGSPRAGWYAGIEFSGRTRIALARKQSHLESRLGLNEEWGAFQTRLAPGESFETPNVFLGAFTGGPDGAGNQLRPWVRAVLGNPITWANPHYPLMANNSWGSGMQVDEALALRMISESKELGLEMFHLDAGWFRGVGDWYPDPKKFPHGLASLADEAHRQGLRFGIWVDWSQAGLDTEPGALNARNPIVRDWLAGDIGPDWKPEEFKGQTIDLGVPAAREYAAREVKRIVDDYHLYMLEHDGYLVTEGCTRNDHPHAPPNQSTLRLTRDAGFNFALGSNSTDVSYHSVRSYYALYETLRRDHPGLLFEICNDGGRMMDFGSAAHGDYFSITDTYDPLSNRRAFYDASYAFPPAMLESYVERWPSPRLDNFVYMLRSGMMGWISIMLDTTAWSPQQHAAARREFSLYKQQLRPLIRDAQLYHISDRPDGVHWDGIEYWDPARGKGVVFAFRGSVNDQSEHRFPLAGLDAHKRYKLHCVDGTSADRETSGGDLMTSGLLVHLGEPLSSELIFVEEASALN